MMLRSCESVAPTHKSPGGQSRSCKHRPYIAHSRGGKARAHNSLAYRKDSRHALSHRVVLVGHDEQGHAEIRQLGRQVQIQEDVIGLDVPMDDALPTAEPVMEVVQPLRDSLGDGEPLSSVQLVDPVVFHLNVRSKEPSIQRLVGHVLVHEKALLVLQTEPHHLHQVLVIRMRSHRLHFCLKSLSSSKDPIYESSLNFLSLLTATSFP
ncbi:hypothetical protein Mapa_007479 [Marchantia paleacea]|nr:hypothetical protein Mapa_007479 [Marchantia paleacea]